MNAPLPTGPGALAGPLQTLITADIEGLDLNRLLFARYLLLTGRIGDGQPDEGSSVDWAGLTSARAY